MLQLVQALLGLVSPLTQGVAVELDGYRVVLHFAVAAWNDTIKDDVNEVVANLERGLWPSVPSVSSRAFVGPSENNGGWEGRQHRLVYLAKP